MKRMKNVNHVSKTYCVNSTEGVAVEIIDYLKNSSAAEPLQCFCRKRLAAALNLVQRVPDISPHRRRESQEVFAAGADKDAGFWRGQFGADLQEYGGIPISCQ